jgi:hypothetical protein
VRLVLAALTLLLAGCASNPNAPSAINQPAGKYRDFADYMIANDPEITKDALAHGATPEQTHCAIEKWGWTIYQSDYPKLSDAVSGKRQITRQDEQWAYNRLRMAQHDEEKLKRAYEDSWASCVG